MIKYSDECNEGGVYFGLGLQRVRTLCKGIAAGSCLIRFPPAMRSRVNRVCFSDGVLKSPCPKGSMPPVPHAHDSNTSNWGSSVQIPEVLVGRFSFRPQHHAKAQGPLNSYLLPSTSCPWQTSSHFVSMKNFACGMCACLWVYVCEHACTYGDLKLTSGVFLDDLPSTFSWR